MQRTAVVVGGGIVGLAAARAIAARHAGMRVVVLEKEPEIALHQTGRNSGVVHSGIYYRPGSLKARTCIAGRRALLDFCVEHRIAHEVCGKVIVATTEEEAARLEGLAERGRANGVRVRRLSGAELREREPAAAGVAALLVEDAGIVDYVGVCRALAAEVGLGGGEVRTGCAAERIGRADGGVRVAGAWGEIRADALVNCAGLHCDRVACRSAASTTGCARTPRRSAGT
jgi:L-2-hydroxyglutarate oxidase